MNVTIVLGTARNGRKSEVVAQKLQTLISAAGAEVTLVDVKDHMSAAVTVPPWGEGGANDTPTEWKTIAEATDAFVFVLPEYNHSFPGEWKLLVDSLYKEYAGKKAYVAAVSNGSFAGARVMEHVMAVLLELKIQVGSARLHVGNVGDLLDEDGSFTDEKTAERFEQFAKTVVDDIL